MKFTQSLYWLLALISTVQALALPAYFSSVIDTSRELYKRKGGGGGGGKGGGGGSSSSGSSSSGSSSGSSSSGSSSGGTTSGGSSGGTTSGGSRGGGSTTGGTTSGTSNTGGRTISGSGPAASYGRGGGYYGGGASVPYRAGTSRGGFVPPLLIGSALIFPALWLYGAYAYPYDRPWTYRNETSGQNETHPVECLCAQYASCGCEQNNTDSTFQQQVANNKTIAQLANVNGTETLVINGTLPNGTTAAGGTDDGSGTTTTTGAASGLKLALIQGSGWWVVVAGVSYTMWFM